LIGYVPSAIPALASKPKYVTRAPFSRMIPESSVSDASVAETRASARFDVVAPYADLPISTSSNAVLSYVIPAEKPRTPSVLGSEPHAFETVASTKITPSTASDEFTVASDHWSLSVAGVDEDGVVVVTGAVVATGAVVVTLLLPLPTMIAPSTRSRSAYVAGLSFTPP